jgi:hypothetical protein
MEQTTIYGYKVYFKLIRSYDTKTQAQKQKQNPSNGDKIFQKY